MASKNITPIIHRTTVLARITESRFKEAEAATTQMNKTIIEATDFPIFLPSELFSNSRIVRAELLDKLKNAGWRVIPVSEADGSTVVKGYNIE